MNRKFCNRIFLFLLLNAIAFLCDAQNLSSPFIVKKYTSYDGLPHNYILNLRQDDHGYLWVGTAYGLCRFDGDNFSPVNIKDGNKNIIATAGNELHDGKIWIWRKNDPEFLFDGKNLLPVPDSLHKARLAGNFEGIFYWGGPKNFLGKLQTTGGWYYNYEHEIIFVNKKGDSLKVDQKSIPGYYMRMIGYSNDQLYVYSDIGLYTWSKNKVRQLFEKQIREKRIYSCYRDSKNRFWIGTRHDGIYISKPGEENILDYHISLSNNLISGFYEDKEGNMWIAAAEGLIKVQDILFEKFSKEEYPFLDEITFMSKGKNEGIFLFSEVTGLTKKSKDKFIYSGNTLFKGQLIDAVCYDKKDRIWCVSRQNRLLMYDGKNYFDFTRKKTVYNGDFALDIAYDMYRDKIWITGDSLSEGDENGFSAFKAKGNKIIKNPHHFISMPGGKIVISTSTNELLLIDSANNISDLNVSGLFTPANIENFFIDSAGNLFISSFEAGLIQCRLMNNDSLVIINRFNTENGLKNNFVNSVSFDKQNRLWVSTMGGIAVIDYKKSNNSQTPMVYHLGLNDGLPEFVGFGHLACDEDGDMWYTTLYTVSKFPVNKMRFINEAPPVNIENVSLNMKETDWSKYSDSLSAKFQLPDHPVLKYFENTITVSFKAVSMINSGGYQYSYMLYGLNNNWSGNSSNTTVTITKLKPGTYTFLVRAKRDNSDWGSPASFTFTIRPAWWQQWWFTALLIIVAAGFIYLLYRTRIGQLNKEKHIRDQIARDLHDDLGSTLNSVKVYANVASIEKDNKQYLEKIKESTQEAITSVRDIIWLLDEKKDTIEHLFTRISQFALPLSGANYIQFIQQIDNSIYNKILSREEKRNFFMIIKEVINNSIKYADCKIITLSAFEERNKLVIQITDDGRGYDEPTMKNGHGMENILKRSIEIRYHAKIKSTPGKGTTVRLEEM